MSYQSTADQFAARMPARGQVNATTPFLSARGAWMAVLKIGSSFGSALMRASDASARTHQIEALHKKSDAELARMGLRRDQIAHYVFKDLYFA
ncbi:MAG: hypothetical protein WBG95_05055 [Sulfitobacter sp.]